SLDIRFLRKTTSFPIDVIADIRIGGQQQVKSVQINSVLVLLKNGNILNLSGYSQSPIVMYYLLRQWFQRYGVGMQTDPT
ncbi:MAG TPA: hypothetical protein VLA72_00490, partial [Anaerolineales bacterium]|nr:hypothetical protein [Anaerolineales bacterium]